METEYYTLDNNKKVAFYLSKGFESYYYNEITPLHCTNYIQRCINLNFKCSEDEQTDRKEKKNLIEEINLQLSKFYFSEVVGIHNYDSLSHYVDYKIIGSRFENCDEVGKTIREVYEKPFKNNHSSNLNDMKSDNQKLRKALALAFSGTRLYSKDGSLEDPDAKIDYVNDSVDKILERIINYNGKKFDYLQHGKFNTVRALTIIEELLKSITYDKYDNFSENLEELKTLNEIRIINNIWRTKCC